MKGCVSDFLSLRTSAHAGVAIPPLEGKCIDNCPTQRENVVFLVVIVAWFHGAGGLPRQFANWLAMTASIRQTTIYRFVFYLSRRDCLLSAAASSNSSVRCESKAPLPGFSGRIQGAQCCRDSLSSSMDLRSLPIIASAARGTSLWSKFSATVVASSRIRVNSRPSRQAGH